MAVEKRRTSAASKPKPKLSIAVTDTQDTQTIHKKVLLAGKSHTGKTYFAAQFPSPLWFDFDHNLETVKNLGNKDPVLTFTSEQFRSGEHSYLTVRKILNELIEGEGPYHELCKELKVETLVFDSISTMSYYFEEELLEHHPNKNRKAEMAERLSLPDYNLILGRMVGVIEKLTSSDLPYHVVCTAHVELATNEHTDAIEEQPLLTGKALGRKIPGMFGDIFLTGYDTKDNVYFATNVPTRRFQYAGNRGGAKVGRFNNPTFKEIYG